MSSAGLTAKSHLLSSERSYIILKQGPLVKLFLHFFRLYQISRGGKY